MNLICQTLGKSYGKRVVVNGVNITLSPGEIVGLLGPNGAGKTTTFYLLVGLLRPDSGRIFLGQEEITNLPMYQRARKGIGYLAQEPSLFRKLSVENNLEAILEMKPYPLEKKNQLRERLLNDLGLEERRYQRASSLSGGEKRRTEIARVLLNEPNFLLLDEPFVGIDPIAVSEIQGIIHRLRQEKNLGILISDHNVRETLEVIDRAYIMYEGKILLEGNARELLASPEARRIYLGEDFQL